MNLLPKFKIQQPSTVEEASHMLAELGDAARPYAGGTELLLAMKMGLLAPEQLVDVKLLPGFTDISRTGESVRIGAAVTHLALETSSLIVGALPVLAEMESRIGNPRVRSAGTVGGNLCFAEPRSDVATLLLALEARCTVASGRERRELSIGDLTPEAYSNSLEVDELLESVTIPIPEPAWKFRYRKYQFHERPALGVAVGVRLDSAGRVAEARLSVAAAPESPRRCPGAEALLTAPLDEARRNVRRAAEIAAVEVALVDDDEYSGDYKQHLLEVLLGELMESMEATGG